MIAGNTPVKQRVRDGRVQALPHPWSAWLTLSSDPDNTRHADWKELDRLIWQELGLPFSDSVFIRSYNIQLPDQVDLHGHPEVLGSHPHDTIHTWGDFMFAGTRGFDRSDAEAHLRTLEQMNFRPRVWVDHSMFIGNLLHNHKFGGIPEFKDASGYTYANQYYTLDLIRKAGVRYFWDGTITSVLGQDRELSLRQYHLERTGSGRRGTLDWMKHKVGDTFGLGKAFRDQFQGNQAYRVHRFLDGSLGYVFPRYGRWELADIQGLGVLLAPAMMDRLVAQGGICMAYTHLGKRKAGHENDAEHVPASTRKSLEHVAGLHRDGKLMLSSLGRLLDYLVLRDHLTIQGAAFTFTADGLAFDTVGPHELAGHSFTIKGAVPQGITVHGTKGPVPHSILRHGDRAFTLQFPEA
jgi:hypothetical protein